MFSVTGLLKYKHPAPCGCLIKILSFTRLACCKTEMTGTWDMTQLTIPVSRVAHLKNTIMVLMVVMEAVAAIHCLMVMIDHNWVDTAVDTVVTHVHWDLRIDNQQATNHHDQDSQVAIIVIVLNTLVDNQTDHLIIGEASQGLARGLVPLLITQQR